MARLDVWLVENGHYSSRQVAKRAIKEGMVTVDGNQCKPSKQVSGKEDIKVSPDYADMPMGYHKLKEIDNLLEGNLVILPCIALDIGSSAGGFLEYPNEKGATVTGIEVARRFSKDLTRIAESHPRISVIFDDAFTIDPTIIVDEESLDLLLVDVTTEIDGTLNLISRFSNLLKKGGCLVAAFKTDNPNIVLQLLESITNLGFAEVQSIYLDNSRQEAHIIGCYK
ncbi:MAG: TlyA family rRNA (cytidine-2'-O)-methyltransferase [Candidatus Thorarchaeota archaeon]|nr:MAG: TlyA family rRNA (cytidine-2'-O)-methyltransferase [Candidatus Thorarchaeota archaeon]